MSETGATLRPGAGAGSGTQGDATQGGGGFAQALPAALLRKLQPPGDELGRLHALGRGESAGPEVAPWAPRATHQLARSSTFGALPGPLPLPPVADERSAGLVRLDWERLLLRSFGEVPTHDEM